MRVLGCIFVICLVACSPIGVWASGLLPDDWTGAQMTSETQVLISVLATVVFALLVFRFLFWVISRIPYAGPWMGKQIIKTTLWARGHKGKAMLRDAFILMIWKDIGGKGQPSSAVIYNRVWNIQRKRKVAQIVKMPKTEQKPEPTHERFVLRLVSSNEDLAA